LVEGLECVLEKGLSIGEKETRLEHLQNDLGAIATAVKKTAQERQGNNLELLALLRLLESLHQEVRDGLFQDSLPDNRQALYALLKDIENNGGWPHIYRMQLQSFLRNLSPEDALSPAAFYANADERDD
jgi:hypothetical protein